VKNFKQVLRSLRIKQKFITNVVNALCPIYRTELLIEFLKKGKSAEPQVAGAIDYSSKEQEAGEQETVATLGDYEYLSSLPFENFTLESLEKLEAELGEKEKELKTLTDTSPDLMWLNDLELFEKEFDVRDNYLFCLVVFKIMVCIIITIIVVVVLILYLRFTFRNYRKFRQKRIESDQAC
jgi:hypothetical protein